MSLSLRIALLVSAGMLVGAAPTRAQVPAPKPAGVAIRQPATLTVEKIVPFTVTGAQPFGVAIALTRPGTIRAEVSSKGPAVNLKISGPAGLAAPVQYGSGLLTSEFRVTSIQGQGGDWWQVQLEMPSLEKGLAAAGTVSGSLRVAYPVVDTTKLREMIVALGQQTEQALRALVAPPVDVKLPAPPPPLDPRANLAALAAKEGRAMALAGLPGNVAVASIQPLDPSRITLPPNPVLARLDSDTLNAFYTHSLVIRGTGMKNWGLPRVFFQLQGRGDPVEGRTVEISDEAARVEWPFGTWNYAENWRYDQAQVWFRCGTAETNRLTFKFLPMLERRVVTAYSGRPESGGNESETDRSVTTTPDQRMTYLGVRHHVVYWRATIPIFGLLELLVSDSGDDLAHGEAPAGWQMEPSVIFDGGARCGLTRTGASLRSFDAHVHWWRNPTDVAAYFVMATAVGPFGTAGKAPPRWANTTSPYVWRSALLPAPSTRPWTRP